MEERFHAIDLFKFLMVIVVIAIHTNPFVQCQSIIIDQIAIIIEDMANPFFFMVSGYLIAFKWGDNWNQHELYIRRKLAATVRLYTVWTLISFPLSLYGYVISGNGVVSCIFSYIKYYLFVGKLYNSYHLWYLLAMIYAMLVMWALVRRKRGIQYFLITGILMYMMSFLFSWFRQSDQVNGLLVLAGKIFYFVFNGGGVFTGMLYMSMGIWIKERGKTGILTCAGGILAGILVRYGLSQELGNMLSSVMFFIMVINMKFPAHPCYIVFRKLSKYMYLSHLLCFSFYSFMIIDQPNKLGVDSFFMTTVLSVIAAAVITYVKGLWKPNVGKKKPTVL